MTHAPKNALSSLLSIVVVLLSGCSAQPAAPPPERPRPELEEQPLAESQPPPSTRETPENSFLHRFTLLPGRGDGPLEHTVVVRAAPSGGVVALVSFDNTLVIQGEAVAGGYRNFAVLRLDEQGEVVWAYAEEGAEGPGGEPQSRYANALAVAENGDVFVGGVFRETGPGFSLMRLSARGHRLWLVEPSRGDHWSEIHDVAVNGDGDVVVVGHFSDRLAIGGLPTQRCSRGCGFVAKLSGADGSPIWVDHLRSADGALVALELAGEEAIVAGHFAPAAVVGETRLRSAGQHDLVVIRYGSDGTPAFGARLGRRGDDLLQTMVALDEGRVALATADHLYVVSEESGEVLWERPLNEHLTLVETSSRRDRVWLARHSRRPDDITILSIAAFDVDGTAQQIGELRTVVYGFGPGFRPTLSQRALLIGGSLADNRWDANTRTPFVISTPLASLLDGEAIEGLPLRGYRGQSRCPAVQRQPEQPNPLELRRGLDQVRAEVLRCGVNPRALRFEIEIAGQGRVERAEVRSRLNVTQASCVSEALQQARFCPFRSERYTVETVFP